MTFESVLTSILALTDALFVPMRRPGEDCYRPISYHRQQFSARGIAWTSLVVGARNGAAQKQTQRIADRLASEKLIHRLERGRVKLTDKGDEYARTLCGLPSFAESFSMLARLSREQDSDDAADFLGKAWIAEQTLTGKRWGTKDGGAYVALEETMLPLLARGFAVSNCTLAGHCWYALTPAGKRESAKPAPPKLATVPRFSEAERTSYYDSIKGELSRLSQIEDATIRDIGQVRLPSSLATRRVLASCS